MGRRTKYQTFFLFLALLLLSSACTERIDIELDTTYTRLVVEAELTSDSLRHYVKLTTTSDYFSNEASPPVSNALVELSYEDQNIQLVEEESETGLYLTPDAFRGIPGTTYELNISMLDADGDGRNETYHALSTMPGGPELESIELRYYPTPVVSGYAVFMYASHPPEQRDWFGFRFIKNSDMLTDSLAKYSVLSDDLFDSGYFPGLPVGFLSDGNSREALHSGDTLSFQLDCIEQAYYDFVTEAQLEIVGNYPVFSGPPANVKSNIDNGALGYFAAYSVQRVSMIVH